MHKLGEVDNRGTRNLAYKQGTIPGRYFDKLYISVLTEVEENTRPAEPNPMYCRVLLEYLLVHVMPFSPLWDGICQNSQKVSSNASIENVFEN